MKHISKNNPPAMIIYTNVDGNTVCGGKGFFLEDERSFVAYLRRGSGVAGNELRPMCILRLKALK